MAKTPQIPPRPTLEDLLRFKREERPVPEFWAEFDRGLRQKQLAALVKRPKGWARVRPVFVRGLRWAVPATAAAAVATVVVQLPLGLASKQSPVEVASRNVASEPVVESATAKLQVAAPSARESVAPVAQDSMQVVAAVSEPVRTQDTETVSDNGSAFPASDQRSLPWATLAMASHANDLDGAVMDFSVRPNQRETRRPRTSWTSRFNQLVHGMGEESVPVASLQFASLDLGSSMPADTSVVASAATGRFVTGATGLGRETDERLLRDLDRRFGVTGSSLSIKF